MALPLTFVDRADLDTGAWNACVDQSATPLFYGYAWYLDAVLPAPHWRWQALVLTGAAGAYRAVMPVPLRRRLGRWVVYQPFFCPMLAVFSTDSTIDTSAFVAAVVARYRYGARLSLHHCPPDLPAAVTRQTRYTQVLDLSAGYEALLAGYTRDRHLNLRRARQADWTLADQTDPEPLLALFRQHHADTIRGGVADWAYTMLRTLIEALQQRGLATLRYTCQHGQPEAGVLIAHSAGRLVYLFNAASETGRRGNARTLLLDTVIRESAGQPALFDFESPEKTSIVDFYRSFGTVDEPYYTLRWNRLTRLETGLNWLRHRLRALWYLRS